MAGPLFKRRSEDRDDEDKKDLINVQFSMLNSQSGDPLASFAPD
jgi:hypothetical protein